MTTSSSDDQQNMESHSLDGRGCPDEGGEASAESGEAALLIVKASLPSLESLQCAALSVYGRLEPDRALVWTVEELGELAQAVRRKEGRSRLEEELGQLTAWMLCLANILGVDLAAAVESAIRGEVDRQINKYGMLVPYEAD
jgi:NTP pyrophosphatase (non-canonical NTP hydrolase)